MLEVRDLSVTLGRRPVLDAITTAFPEGALTALLGPNGCGKSTLLRAIMGLVDSSAGSVTLDGAPLAGLSRRARAQRIAWMPQESSCPDYLTLAEMVALAGHARRSLLSGLVRGETPAQEAAFARALETVGLAGEAARPVNSLSGGQRQRAFIALALAQQAETLLLDEPVNHLDPRYQYAILALLRDLAHRQGQRVVVVLHDLNLAGASADRVVLMNEGRIVAQGAPAEVLTPARIEETFALPVEILPHGARLLCVPILPGTA